MENVKKKKRFKYFGNFDTDGGVYRVQSGLQTETSYFNQMCPLNKGLLVWTTIIYMDHASALIRIFILDNYLWLDLFQEKCLSPLKN